MENKEILVAEVGMDENPVMDVVDVDAIPNESSNGLVIVGITVAALGLGYAAYRGGKWIKAKIDAKRAEKEELQVEKVTIDVETK